MQTENSSISSKKRAESLASALSANHASFNFDSVMRASLDTVGECLGNFVPRFAANGGSSTENLALQNLQARLRMTLGYFYSQLAPMTTINTQPPRHLLVLASANADETVCGYFTKYDNSSGDLNPIGSFSKDNLRKFVAHFREVHSETFNEPLEA